MAFAARQSQALVDHAKRRAEEAGVAYRFLQGPPRKDQLVDAIWRRRPDLVEGLVCAFCCMGCGPRFKLVSGAARPRLVAARRQQRALDSYPLDPQSGLIDIRLTTRFPCTIPVDVNGHSWLAQAMLRRRLGFDLQDNAVTAPDDPRAAQELADSFAELNWTKILDHRARRVNPLRCERWSRGLCYYWVVDQAEDATDLIFTGRAALAGLDPRRLDHAAVTSSANDIRGFLGRRFHPRFDGEVLTDCQERRRPGARIKHRVTNNWLKMYDKFGRVLRIETVINDPREFRARRLRTRAGRREMVWCPMHQGVINLDRYREVAPASTRRYRDALAVVDDPQPAHRQVEELTEPVVVSGRVHAGFNPASPTDVRLFRAARAGENRRPGFRDADIRAALSGTTEDVGDRHRQSHAVGRLLKRLHVRGLIVKVPHSHRWPVSQNGQQVLGAVVQWYHHGIPAAMRTAA
jgi:hypothetical protein